MKRSWLIGAALLLSLSAVACGGDDDNTPVEIKDSSVPTKDASTSTTVPDGGLDAGSDLDSGSKPEGDAGDAATKPDAT
jgi:hypothetical protein